MKAKDFELKTGHYLAIGALAALAINWKSIKALVEGSGSKRSQFPIYPSAIPNPIVAKVQEGLMRKNANAKKIIQDTGGADGIFGNGTKQALVAAGFESGKITKAIYEQLTKALAGLPNPISLCRCGDARAKRTLELTFMDGTRKAIGKGEVIGKLVGRKEGIALFQRPNGQVAAIELI